MRSIASAKANDDKLIVELDTPGGEVQLAWVMARLLDEASKEGVQTIAWVNDHALSAGALLALACDEGRELARRAVDALEVDAATLQAMFEKGKAAGIETRGVADHGFIHSIYFRDPNGYVIELTAPTDGAADYAVEAAAKAHDALVSWQETKPRA